MNKYRAAQYPTINNVFEETLFAVVSMSGHNLLCPFHLLLCLYPLQQCNIIECIRKHFVFSVHHIHLLRCSQYRMYEHPNNTLHHVNHQTIMFTSFIMFKNLMILSLYQGLVMPELGVCALYRSIHTTLLNSYILCPVIFKFEQ